MICQKNMAARGLGLFSRNICIENFNDLLVRNHWTDFNPLGFVKKHGRRGRGLFSLYIYIEKNLLVRNHWPDFHIILLKCSFGNPLPRLFKPFGFIKNMADRGRGLFSLYIYIGNLKNLLVRSHWTDFSIILQKCFFGDSVPRLSKTFGFVEKHGRQGAELIFPIYL